MDIEGAERQPLTGARETLSRWKPRLEISVDHLPGDPVEIPRLVRQASPGYRVPCLVCVVPKRTWTVEPAILFFYAPLG